MQVDLHHEVAVVTGGGNGIGRAIVLALAANGARVVVVDREGDAAATVAAEAGNGALSYAVDVTDLPALEALATTVAGECGKIDILVNNAGIGTYNRVPLHEVPPDEWKKIVDVDLTGVFYVSRAFLPHLIATGSGRVVNISSVAGIVPLRLQSAYVAAKAGVATLTKAMAAELGAQGVRVNCVAPGSTLTRATQAVFYKEDGTAQDLATSLLSHVPLGRPGTPEEIAAAVLFLASPDSAYVTGVVLPVDGGWLCSYHRDW
jgi:NAD(P)-dependent dehydrogenase (short-subunit alcohol dehydrogenase family)